VKIIDFYKKNEIGFSIFWIIFYLVLLSCADTFSSLVGIEKIFSAPLSVGIVIFLTVWMQKNGLLEQYGIKKAKFERKKYLFFLPLIVMISVNFWSGVQFRFNVIETVLFIISMLCVGFLEELIFRGFLFKALCKENVTSAIIISSITFGVGHIINLFSGAELIPTFLQIGYATSAGFLFTVIFYKSGNLFPCIITHSLMNATSIFYYNKDLTMETITSIFLIFISLGYAFWILRINNLKSQKNSEDIKMK
jgi:membrane protease YdiL (CAAX protease family)